MRQCPFCSKEVHDSDIICQHCGRAIYSVEKTIQSGPQVQLSNETLAEDKNDNILSDIVKKLIWGIIFILIGLSAIVISVVHFYRLSLWDRDGGHAVGEVVNISCWDEDWGSGCDYEIQFEIPDGRTFEFTPFFSRNYNLADKVAVVYSLDDPQNAEVKEGGEFSRIMTVLFGVMSLILGISLLSHIRKMVDSASL